MSEINSESKLKLSIKEVIASVIGLASLFGIYFTLQGQVDNNMEDI